MKLALIWLALAAHATAHATAQADPAWEVNGIRLEAAQVERLADDLAGRTVSAVTEKVSDLRLQDGQRERLRAIYRAVALETYERVIPVVQDPALDAEAKQERVRALVLEGQRASHEQITNVLDARQMALYTDWETTQVAAFQSRRLDRRRTRSR
jgi:hypothetical protein